MSEYRQASMFDTYEEDQQGIRGCVRELSYEEAMDFIMDKHYAGRKPPVSVAYGWFIHGDLVAACTFGKPASNFLCEAVCGKKWADSVFELNRLVRVENLQYQLSEFVAYCLRQLKPRNWIIVSFSDMGMHHHGYIYQACNFLYTGVTRRRTDVYGGGVTHPRTLADKSKVITGIRQVRTIKHRYIYFCTSNRRLKKEWRNALRWPVLPYPKGDNENYVLGTVYKPELIVTEDEHRTD